MNTVFILDACALIALLAGETGAEKVKILVQDAIDNKIILKINQINLLEVYYFLINTYNQNDANNAMEKIKEFPIDVIIGLSDGVFKEAGRIKSKYKIPLGDSIIVAECIINNWTLVTSDYTDFGKIEKEENIGINWFR